MTSGNTNKNIEKIREQIDHLKVRLDNIDKNLDTQQEALDTLYENSKTLLNEAFNFKNKVSVEEIMKRAFSKGNIPKIIFKNRP